MPCASLVRRDGTDAQNPGVTSGHWGVEGHDWLWLKIEQAHVTYVTVTVTNPHISAVTGIQSVNGGSAGKLEKNV